MTPLLSSLCDGWCGGMRGAVGMIRIIIIILIIIIIIIITRIMLTVPTIINW